MQKLLQWLKDRLLKPVHEPVYDEPVAHDTVMILRDGKLLEVTEDDPEIR